MISFTIMLMMGWLVPQIAYLICKKLRIITHRLSGARCTKSAARAGSQLHLNAVR